jgi:hypothetical protein
MARDNVRRPTPLAAWLRGPERSSEVIICNQGQSGVIIRSQRALSGTQRALSGTQSHSEATQWAPQRPSEVLSGSSEVIRGTQRLSEVIRDHSELLRASQWHSAALRGTQRGLGTRSSLPLALRIARPSTLSLTSAPPTSSLTHLLSSLLCSTHSGIGCPFTAPLVTAHRWRWFRRSSLRTRRPPRRRRTRYAAPPPLPRG